jgi:membrane associated rhomboid family serine protease
MLPISDGELKTLTFPIVNISLIVVCTLVFIYELTLGGIDKDIFFFQFGLIPAELTRDISLRWLQVVGPIPPLLLEANPSLLESLGYYANIDSPIPSWATMFTSMFIHGGWMHFIGNMLFLWVFGDNVEDRFGHFRYLLFYLLAGVAASGLQIATDTASEIPAIGASGAIAGVLGAYLLLYPYSRVSTLVIFFVIRIPAYFLLGFWFVLQFFEGVGSLGMTGGGVAYWAHIGGFLAGMVVVVIYKLFKGEPLWPKDPGGGFGGGNDMKYWRGRPLNY